MTTAQSVPVLPGFVQATPAHQVSSEATCPSRSSTPANPAYQVSITRNRDDVIAAQRLRFAVFAGELGAITPGPDGLDRDRFDAVCDHVIVWCGTGPDRRAVATYRLLPARRSIEGPRSRGLYTATEFDIDPLAAILPDAVEAGRACVDPEHRTGAAIMMLWAGILRYLRRDGYRYLIGCASVDLADGGATAAGFADLGRSRHRADLPAPCRPRTPFAVDGIVRPDRLHLPPLLRAYLNLGARVCGDPAYDAQFQTADFLVLLDLNAANPRMLERVSAGDAVVIERARRARRDRVGADEPRSGPAPAGLFPAGDRT